MYVFVLPPLQLGPFDESSTNITLTLNVLKYLVIQVIASVVAAKREHMS